MKPIVRLFICFFLFFQQVSFSQNDTLISFDVNTRTIKIIPPQIYDKNIQSENTEWNVGSFAGLVNLPLSKPSTVFPGAGFTDYLPAQKYFSVTNYPIRTAVKLLGYKNGKEYFSGSGIFVSKDLVLTVSHCVYNYFDTTGKASFFDSMAVLPAFDNGKENATLNKSISSKYFIPKSNIENYLLQDVALIKVREPIGSTIGWVGISFFNKDSVLMNKVFHKLSYPGTIDPNNPARKFNGDTLYYNYGILDVIESNKVGYNINGISGQSGSSLFYTDNVSYYSIGVLNWADNSMHYRFSSPIYHAFKNVINESTNDVKKPYTVEMDHSISNAYPNPFNPITTVKYSVASDSFVELDLIDILGRHVQKIVSENRAKGVYTQTINAENLPSGVYYLVFCANEYREIKKLILLK